MRPEKNIDSERLYSTGRRKESSARVWLKYGNGSIIINDKPLNKYFIRAVLRTIINQPFIITSTFGQYDVFCTVKGGGTAGQAGAVMHAITKALNIANQSLRPVLSSAGLLTRDSRTVERKKPGRKKARKRFQFSKR